MHCKSLHVYVCECVCVPMSACCIPDPQAETFTGGLNTLRVGQNRLYTLYVTIYLVIPLPDIPYMHRIFMVLANPNNTMLCLSSPSITVYTITSRKSHGLQAASVCVQTWWDI